MIPERTLLDLVLDLARAVIAGVTVLGFLFGRRARALGDVAGWRLLVGGFSLLFFGAVLDVTDNFPALNRFVVIGRTGVEAVLEKVVGYLFGLLLVAAGIWRWLPRLVEHERRVRVRLEQVEERVEALSGLLPICAACKKIRDDAGDWRQLEVYISERSDARFSHGICPECLVLLYPEAGHAAAPGGAEARPDR